MSANKPINSKKNQDKSINRKNKLPFLYLIIDYSDTILFLGLITLFFGYTGSIMGIDNLFSTLFNTSYELLIDTVFYIMAIAVLAGAFGKMASEFKVIKLLNYIFAPLMKPLYKLPGVSFLGIVTTYLSDNPAIISLAKEDDYLAYFKEEDIPLLCNLGTAFGMGLILTTFMAGLGFFKEALIGNVGAIAGSVVSVRLMRYQIKRKPVDDFELKVIENNNTSKGKADLHKDNRGLNNFFERLLSAMLEGGKQGVEIGLSIIPGVLVICTLIMILTFGPADPSLGFQGEAFEGVKLLPRIGEVLSPILKPLLGFSSPEAIAFPITALGAVGAALSLIPTFLSSGLISGHEIAVFTAIGMCWSGFLSTHVAMLDALNRRPLISRAIFSHFCGGIAAGITANLLFRLLT
ncbi:MAG: hypothetical protein ABR596_03515 [Halarsenatibacteraceae bacterium]